MGDNFRKMALWATSKIYRARQGTDHPGCRALSHLSRDVEFPECVFGEPVPELRMADLMTSAWNARHFAEGILSSNPTACAANTALKAYDIFGTISTLRMSEVARHGRTTAFGLRLQKLEDSVDALTIDCKEPWKSETVDERTKRIEANEWKFSREVFNTDECTVLRHYNGSGFAKPHGGSFNGCKAECDLEPSCNAFNMDLRFGITIKQAQCDLLQCSSTVSKSEKFGHVAFVRVDATTVDLSPDSDSSDASPIHINTNNCDECRSDRECCRKSNDECAINKTSGMCVERDDCSSGRRLGNFQVARCGPGCCKRKPKCTYSKTHAVCKSS